jgi:two-component sensor histidine kinase
MAVHELATNAAKFGALSVAGGRVEIGWSVEEGPPARLRLWWEEHGGPPVAQPPEEGGVGTRVLQATLARQLGGEVWLRWEAEGLRCAILLPAARVLVAGEAAREQVTAEAARMLAATGDETMAAPKALP